MNQIKNSFIRKKSENLVDRTVCMKHPSKMRKILLITNQENKSLKKKLESIYPDASIYHLFLREIKEDRTTGFYYSAHDADFNLTGLLKNDKLMQLEKMQLDLLVDLSADSDLLKYFTNKSKASLKVGDMESDNSAHYDLLVEFYKDENRTIDNINEHLLKLTRHAVEQV